jgi:hypothetical protein
MDETESKYNPVSGSSTNFQEVQKAKDHAESYHECADTKIQMVGHYTGWITLFLQKKLNNLKGGKGIEGDHRFVKDISRGLRCGSSGRPPA